MRGHCKDAGYGSKARVVVYRDTELKIYFGRANKSLEIRKLVRSDLLLDESRGIEVHDRWNLQDRRTISLALRPPYYGPLFAPMLFVPSKSQLRGPKEASFVFFDIWVHRTSFKAQWVIQQEPMGLTTQLRGPMVGLSADGKVGVGGMLERRLVGGGSKLLSSRVDVVLVVDKNVYLQSMGRNDPDVQHVKIMLANSSFVVTRDEALLRSADSDDAQQLPLSKPMKEFLSDMKKDKTR